MAGKRKKCKMQWKNTKFAGEKNIAKLVKKYKIHRKKFVG